MFFRKIFPDLSRQILKYVQLDRGLVCVKAIAIYIFFKLLRYTEHRKVLKTEGEVLKDPKYQWRSSTAWKARGQKVSNMKVPVNVKLLGNTAAKSYYV